MSAAWWLPLKPDAQVRASMFSVQCTGLIGAGAEDGGEVGKDAGGGSRLEEIDRAREEGAGDGRPGRPLQSSSSRAVAKRPHPGLHSIVPVSIPRTVAFPQSLKHYDVWRMLTDIQQFSVITTSVSSTSSTTRTWRVSSLQWTLLDFLLLGTYSGTAMRRQPQAHRPFYGQSTRKKTSPTVFPRPVSETRGQPAFYSVHGCPAYPSSCSTTSLLSCRTSCLFSMPWLPNGPPCQPCPVFDDRCCSGTTLVRHLFRHAVQPLHLCRNADSGVALHHSLSFFLRAGFYVQPSTSSMGRARIFSDSPSTSTNGQFSLFLLHRQHSFFNLGRLHHLMLSGAPSLPDSTS